MLGIDDGAEGVEDRLLRHQAANDRLGDGDAEDHDRAEGEQRIERYGRRAGRQAVDEEAGEGGNGGSPEKIEHVGE